MTNAFIDLQPAIAQVSAATAATWGPDTVAMVTGTGATIQQTNWELWNSQTTSVEGLISTFDGSVTATNNLEAATKARYQTEQALVNELATAIGNVKTSFDNANEAMTTGLMTADQKVQYYADKANAEEKIMYSETDPTKLYGESQQYLQYQSSAWSNMTPAEQQAAQPGWVAENTNISAYLTKTLGVSLDTISTESGKTLPDQITGAISSAFAPVTTAQQGAANDMRTAANNMIAAANTFLAAANVPKAPSIFNNTDSQVAVVR